MKKLKIADGRRFKIHIEKQVSEDSLFFHEYEIAINSLNNIWNIQDNSKNENNMVENPNNIIAFCGERGSGKSSVMMSFIQTLVRSGEYNDKLKLGEDIRNNNWKTNIIVDPSMFDEVHNIVDIVLAHIYQDFQLIYEKNNQSVEQYEREKMMMQLSKVYKSLSIINNKEKMLDDEYDEAGNISKLQKLGVSTRLREDLKELIKMYLEFASKQEGARKCKKLLIAIDDLDLCNENVYRMAEQIRKYLILPNIIIVMAVKIEQFEMGVEEKNREDFKNIIQGKGRINSIDKEMQEMAERYTTKLIPKARRIYLPKLKSNQVELEGIVLKDERRANHSLVLENKLLNLICEKTGIYFVPSENGYSYLIPSNLRDLINFISLFDEMEYPGENIEIKQNNILEFKIYFIEEMIRRNIRREELEDLMEVIESDDRIKNFNMCNLLNKILVKKIGNLNIYANSTLEFMPESLAIVIERLTNNISYLTLNADNLLFNYIKIYYTIILNEKFVEKIEIEDPLIRGFIWGNRLNGVVPWIATENRQFLMSRDRFFINIFKCWNAIVDVLEKGKNLLSLERKDVSKTKVTAIRKDNGYSEIIIWILTALLSSNFESVNNGKSRMNRNPLIANNYAIPPNVSVSLENYIINLCELDNVFSFLNLELLGVEWADVKDIFSLIEKKNANLIKQAKTIVMNVELSLQLLEHCVKNNDYKKAMESDEDRTYQLIKKFMDNVSNFMEQVGMEQVDWTKLWIPLEKTEEGEIKGDEIDICRIYAHVCAIEEKEQKNLGAVDVAEIEKQNLKRDFAQRIEKIATEECSGKIKSITGSITEKNRYAGYVKDLLENIANSIQQYTYKEKKMPEGFDSKALMKLYSEIVDLYVENPQKKINEEQHNEYKAVAQIKNIIK